MSRAFLGILTRVLLVIFTFVLIVALAQLALVSASTRAEHLGLGEVVRRAWEDTQDYFTSVLQGSLGEASSTSIRGGRRRSIGDVLLDAYPKSMVLVGLAVVIATALGLLVGVAAAATSSRRLRGALLGVTVLAVPTPSFLLAVLLILLSATMVSKYGIRLWPSFGFGWDDHLILPVIVLAARPFAQIASFAYVAVDETLGRGLRAARPPEDCRGSSRLRPRHTPRIGTSDHFSYLRRRVPAITVGPTNVGPFHTTGDTTASVDPKRLRESGEVVVQALLEMGASE